VLIKACIMHYRCVWVVPECRDDKKPHRKQWMLQQQQRDWPAICRTNKLYFCMLHQLHGAK